MILLLRSTVILVCLNFACGVKTRMVCEELDNIFGERNTQPVSPDGTVVQGKPGKRGAIGPKGEKGPPGPPGPINEEAITRLESEFGRQQTSTQEIVEGLRRRLSHLEANFVSKDLIETCDFLYKSKCFFLLMTASRVNRPEAEALCRGKGGHLADIIDRTHFEKAQSLIRSKSFIAHSYNHIWTGMDVDIQRRKIRLSTGQWAPYQRWYPYRPFTPARRAVGIHTDFDTKSANTGMFDEHETYKLLGGLCQKNVN